ncbi:GNAT family N-acetyltransferase [Rummeliibacillus sp. JY-2-4R]
MNIRKLRETEAYPMQLLLLADPSEILVKEYLQRGLCYVMEEDNQIIGEYVLLPTRPNTIELINLAVDESQHNKGIGKKLIFHAIETAKTSGYKIIEVGTGNSSINQIVLYQKCGFRITHIDRDFFLRHYSHKIFENEIQCIDMIRFSQDL